MTPTAPSAERRRVDGFGRLDLGLRQASDWYLWGPYLSERQWGTVREDYSADGDAWTYLPHDHARSRAYRWGEDGLAGFCDIEQRLCLALALWNGRDPILKERAFGLTGTEGNHGEDVKEYWWYLDALPSHALEQLALPLPAAGSFPTSSCLTRTAGAASLDFEYELLDTGVFDDDRYWIVDVHYAKADPTDVLMTISVTNAGPETELLHVLPTLWYRNTWSWDVGTAAPTLAATAAGTVAVEHPFLGDLELLPGPAPQGGGPELLFCDNETNVARLYGVTGGSRWPKDGINDHVVSGADTVNPQRRGSKCAAWYRLTVDARRDRRAAAAAASGRHRTRPGHGAGRGLHPGGGPAARRGGRVLRRAHPGRGVGRRGRGDASGVRRDAVEQAVLLLRGGPLARRRPDPAAAPARSGSPAATPAGAASRRST